MAKIYRLIGERPLFVGTLRPRCTMKKPLESSYLPQAIEWVAYHSITPSADAAIGHVTDNPLGWIAEMHTGDACTSPYRCSSLCNHKLYRVQDVAQLSALTILEIAKSEGIIRFIAFLKSLPTGANV
jgi:hypothetical protein